MSLKNTEEIEKILKLVITTGKIKNAHPVSMLLLANVGGGKTEILKKFNKNKGIAYVTDATAYGLTKEYLNEIEKGNIHHIMIPDLITPLSKQTATRQGFISFLNGLIEEGIADMHSYAVQFNTKKDLKCGLITALAKEDFDKNYYRWSNMGFLSRCIPVSYSYGTKEIKQIFDHISAEDTIKNTKEKVKNIKKHIKGNEEIHKKLYPIVNYAMNKSREKYGFRKLKQFKTLLKANAYLNERNAINMDDYNEIVRLLNYVNTEYNIVNDSGGV